MDSWIFEYLKENYGPLAMNLWKDLFQVYELSEIMRQKEDGEFAELLSRLREGSHTKEDVDMLRSRVVHTDSDSPMLNIQAFPTCSPQTQKLTILILLHLKKQIYIQNVQLEQLTLYLVMYQLI